MINALADILRAAWYEHMALRWGSPSPHFLMKSRALGRLLSGIKPQAVLDVGCDTGLHGFLTARRLSSVQQVDGFDVNETAIAKANNLAHQLELTVQSRHWVGDMETESLHRAYDLVLWIDCIQYSATPSRLLGEIAEHLSCTGLLVLYCPVTDGIDISLPPWVLARLPDWSRVTHPRRSDEMVDLVDATGLRVKHVRWVGRRPYRVFRSYEYWLRSYSLFLGYAIAPVGWILAWADCRVQGRGSGVFIVAERAL